MTSANTVRMLAERAAALGVAVAQPVGLKVAAVGSATAEAARLLGYDVTLTPESYIAESLVESLRGKVEGKRVLVARAAVARDVIPGALRAAGAEVDVVEAYRNGTPEGAAEQLRRAVEAGVWMWRPSPASSSVTYLAKRHAWLGWTGRWRGLRRFRLGRLPAGRCARRGREPAAEAESYDIPGLIAAVERILRR